MANHGELIAQFCAITGAPAYTAENYLEAHEYELERAVDFYLEHPPQNHPPVEAEEEATVAAQQPAVQQPEAFDQDVVEITGNDDDGESGLPELARQRQRAPAAQQQAQQQMEGIMGEAHNMLRRAGIDLPHHMRGVQGLGISTATAHSRARRAGVSHPLAADIMDVDDDEVAAEIAAVAAPGSPSSSYHHLQQQQLLAHYQQLAQQRRPQEDVAEDPEAAEAMAGAQAGEVAAAAAHVGGTGLDTSIAAADIPLDLPDGINLEEARMLEAAMLGIPYQGRMPDFSSRTAAQVTPASPGAMDRRNLQAEQDAAYEESLALDRAKQESMVAAQAAEEARQQAEQEEAEAAARAEEEAKQNLAALLAAKQLRLSAEPGSGEHGSVTLVVRMPDGSRKGRRFTSSDPLQRLFDFVDVQCAQAAAVAGDAASGIKPGSYRLVTQFPRKVYVEGTGDTLQEAGINSDTALFLEL